MTDLDLHHVLQKVTISQTQAANIHLNPEKHGINPEVIQKGGKDYTNVVDIAVENLQKQFLKKAFPEIGFLGEETETIEGERYFWIVDPTDGTAVYSTGGEYYSNSVALADRESRTIPFGSVYQSAIGRQFVRINNEVWIRESTIEKNGKHKTIERIPQPSQSRGLPELMGCVILPSKYRNDNPELAGKLGKVFQEVEFPALERSYSMIDAKPASGSSALFCCDIADGNRHFALLYKQKAWDMAGGALIARDAGCIVKPADLEQQIARCTKNTLLDVEVYANPYVQYIAMSRFNG